jgi:predicted Rossmann-fold nucleotide-binding protein
MKLRRDRADTPPPDRQLLMELHSPQPGPPRPLLGRLRRMAQPKGHLYQFAWRRGRFATYAVAVAVVIGLGIWGFHQLVLRGDRLTWWQSVYHGLKLLALDWGPAGGVGPGYRPNWQLVVALILAGLLIARAAWALVRSRARGWITGHLLRNHVIICGAGVHGSALARDLSDACDVVLVDIDDGAFGSAGQVGVHEWRISGDATQRSVLELAGARRAAWVVAIAGNDVVNSQIASAVATVKERRDDLLVLVQVEDPSLARFLEEEIEEELDDVLDPTVATSQPAIVSFSTNAIAADWLLDNIGSPPREIEVMTQPHLLLAGDHPLIDAVILASLRRWRAKTLHDLESSDHSRLESVAGSEGAALRISVYGPDALRRVEHMEHRWFPEAQVIQLEAKDTVAGDTTVEADDWLRKRADADQAICASLEESESITLTLGLARALGDGALLTRVTAIPASQLDEHIKKHSAASSVLANVEVRQLATIGCSRKAMSGISKHERLTNALEKLGMEHQQAWARAKEALEDGRQPVIRTDSAWRVTPIERGLVQPLVDPVPVSALVQARLAVDLNSAEVLRLAATRLLDAAAPLDSVPASNAFIAWCEYVRYVRNECDASFDVIPPELETYTGHLIPDRMLRLGQRSLGGPASAETDRAADTPLRGATGIVLLAGGAKGMASHSVRAMTELLGRALDDFDGVLLSGGTPVGLSGVVGTVAGRLGLRAIGYLPTGATRDHGYTEFRETPDSNEFTVLEPLAMWTDIFAAGIAPVDVRLLVCPGGPLTYAEILLARALGARIGWLDPAAELPLPLDDVLPFGAEDVVELPADAMTIRCFLRQTRAPDEIREGIARLIHNEYRIVQQKPNRKASDDPALAPWDRLTPALKASNFAQADDIPNKLAIVGKRLAKGGHPLELSGEQIELLAEVEHGRFNVERLTAGWRRGDRHIRRLTSPHLKPWRDLTDDIREYDREAVRNIALALEDTGWGVVDA